MSGRGQSKSAKHASIFGDLVVFVYHRHKRLQRPAITTEKFLCDRVFPTIEVGRARGILDPTTYRTLRLRAGRGQVPAAVADTATRAVPDQERALRLQVGQVVRIAARIVEKSHFG